jgi:aspartokinase
MDIGEEEEEEEKEVVVVAAAAAKAPTSLCPRCSDKSTAGKSAREHPSTISPQPNTHFHCYDLF